jgi:large subunit ribosomal protein L15
MNELSKLTPPAGAVTRRKRVGRGPGSGVGKTSGRGQKGQNSRSGGGPAPGFEGGQMPLYRRLPKRGFSNYGSKLDFVTIQVSHLDRFEAGDTVDIDALKRVGLVSGHDVRVKLVAGGELATKVVVKASRVAQKGSRPERSKSERRAERLIVSKSAADAIAAVGGEVQVS